MKPFCFSNNVIIESARASCHPLDIGLIRGYAIFDFFRTVGPNPLFLDDYLTRFTNSAKKAHLPLSYSKEDLAHIIQELIERNHLFDGGIRMILSGGISDNFFTPSIGDLFIFCESLKLPGTEKYEKGVKLLPVEYVRPIPKIKTTNYTLPCFLSVDWASEGAEDVLYHHLGLVSESSRSNVFMVKDGLISTPATHILEGITRKKVMELAPDIQERDVFFDEILEADEVFITSTTKRILPITQIGDKKIGDGNPGRHTRSLMQSFELLEQEIIGYFR
nr:branched-chain amino acid aminotransferase [Cytophagales bacterium]